MYALGENYAQELVEKTAEVSHANLQWHFIGRLQRNKVKWVVGRVHLIHSLDSLPLAQAIDRYARKIGIVQKVLLAVNIAGEETKGGVRPEQVGEILAQLRGLANIDCLGMATMPPLAQHPEDSRQWFRELAQLRAKQATPEQPLSTLSMGTSRDFEVAIEERATIVRLGTVIFGPRT